MRKFMTALSIAFTSMTLTAKPLTSTFTVQSYISKYRLIAQLESQRSGIPASIVLAQAILESGYGNSDLCQRSKNHFGIKWKNGTDGDFVYSYDDDYDKNGKHIPSKFINYEDDMQSFRHHTDFLVERPHYKPLFRFDRSDFVSWAYGLRACGYSTDKNYGTQLIQLIRRYTLNVYDLPKPSKKKISKPLEDTKMVFNIFAGKTLNWSILLKSQSLILEETNLAIANEPKIEQSIASCSSIPFHLPKLPEKKLGAETGAYIRSRSEIY